MDKTMKVVNKNANSQKNPSKEPGKKPSEKPRKTASKRKCINLALQGGGSHGAFTWGVLDRILEDGRLEIDAISGTSAGAMNAVALADGFNAAGADARAQSWKASGTPCLMQQKTAQSNARRLT